jgi:putative methionine-R-sulfoxide reductase with GAF domain/GGDEF domain-containing protein
VPEKLNIAILGGDQEELSILSECHRSEHVAVLGIYDLDSRAIALEIAEIVGVPTFTDSSFLKTFCEADFVIVSERRRRFEKEIYALEKERATLLSPSEAVGYLSGSTSFVRTVEVEREEPAIFQGEIEVSEPREAAPLWPSHLEEALQYITRITDRDRLLKWLLEVSVRSVNASSGSIMLYSEPARQLYIGYASGLSEEVVSNTRQSLGEGIAGKVAETREAVLLREIIDTPLYRDGREREQILSAISAPLINNGRLLGVLNISTNVGERVLDDSDIETIKLLAGKITPILEQHLKFDVSEIREIEFQIRSYLESLFHRDIGFHDKFTFLCRFLAEQLQADTVTIYTATDEGDWLILGGSDHQIPLGTKSPRIHCIKGSLAKAYLDMEEVLMTEARHDAGLTLKVDSGSITSIYIPLVHNERLGILVMEFSNLDALERFFKLKDTLRFQVGFFTYSQLHELRQARKMVSLEKLSSLTPDLMAISGISRQIKQLPSMISALINAHSGSLHYSNKELKETAYFNFPDDEKERKKRIAYDDEILREVLTKQEPVVLSMLSVDVDMFEKPPNYGTVIGYPLYRQRGGSVVYIGYNKEPETALDSSIFGKHEIGILKRVGDVLQPVLKKSKEGKPAVSPPTFDNLLRSNQKVLLERLNNEIERAERYHHGFTLTLFKVNGLKELFANNYQAGLDLINHMSLGIRKKVRKTDYFSWIESDIFGVLSLESYQRIGYLEDRLNSYVIEILSEKGLYDPESFYPVSSYTLYPGRAESAADLINEAKTKISRT